MKPAFEVFLGKLLNFLGLMADALNVFLSYSHDDEAHLQELLKHLALLKRQGLVYAWHDREISAGDAWRGQIDENLEVANMILLLVSPSFIASDYCWDVETQRALERHTQGGARVIPVIVRPCEWRESPFAELQILPKDGLPITAWEDPDWAWLDVTSGLRQALTSSEACFWTPREEEVDPSAPPQRMDRVEIWNGGFGTSEEGQGEQATSDQRVVNAYPRKASDPTASEAYPDALQLSVEEPQPKFRDFEARRISERLSTLYQRREALVIDGEDTQTIDNLILDVRRLLREGPQLQPGEFLEHGCYRLLELVGQGGFATVWKAWDKEDRRLVAVKVLHGQFSEDRSRRERFFRGARKMSELAHPHLVRVLSMEGMESGWHFFVMEYVRGGNFEQAVLCGELSVEERMRAVLQVGEALHYAHSEGIVHRDVKPTNILLGEQKRAKLTDFDLVRAGDTTGMTRSQAMMGTLQFAAPEILVSAKDAEPSADVYSLGATTVFALRGERLSPSFFRNPDAEIRSLNLSSNLERTLLRATAEVVEERFEGVQEFCAALRLALTSMTLESGFVSTAPILSSVSGNELELRPKTRLLSTPPVLSLMAHEQLVEGEKGWSKWLTLVLSLWCIGIILIHFASLVGAGTEELEALPKSQDTRKPGELSNRLPLGIQSHFIPAGTFEMGSPEEEEERFGDEEQHFVEITRGFWMMKTEVTQVQWQEIMERNPSYSESCGLDCPVERVNWYEALEFANELSKLEGLNACYRLLTCTGDLGSGCVDGKGFCAGDYLCKTVEFAGLSCDGYRLPTESEWERAARSEGNSKPLKEVAWYRATSNDQVHAVARKEPNAWNLHDMLGNVHEWTWDQYSEYPNGLLRDPLGYGQGRVFRGCGYLSGAQVCRIAYRGSAHPGNRYYNVGFRLVRTALP